MNPLPPGFEVKEPELGIAVLVVTLDPMLVKLKLSVGCLGGTPVFALFGCSMILSTEY